jgi:hypothetical protein
MLAEPAHALWAANTVDGMHVSSMRATENSAGTVARFASVTPSK